MLSGFAGVEDAEVGLRGFANGDDLCGVDRVGFSVCGEVGVNEIADFSGKCEKSHGASVTDHDTKSS